MRTFLFLTFVFIGMMLASAVLAMDAEEKAAYLKKMRAQSSTAAIVAACIQNGTCVIDEDVQPKAPKPTK